MRLVPTMLAVGLIAASPLVASPLVASPLAVSPPVHRRAISRPRVFRHPRLVEGLTIAGLVFAGARLTGNGVSMTLFDRQFSQDLAALEAIPRNTRFVSLVVEACHTTYATWNRERRGHLAGYAIGRRHDFSNDQWNIPGQQLLQVHNPAAGEFASDPSQMTTAQACEDKPAMMQLVGRIPMTTRYLWLLDSGPHRAIPGWHPIQFSTDSMVYLRNSFDRQTIATATAASALVPRYDRQ